MSVTTTLNKVIHTGNDVASDFAFTFKVFAQTNLVVTKYTISDGSLDVLTLTTDYTVTLTDSGAGGGKVTLVAGALSSDYKLVIERQLTIEQTTDYVENADFSADVIETSLDRLTMICQQLKEQLDRMISGNITTDAAAIYSPPDYTIPTIAAGDALKLLRAKATEDDYELKTMAQVVDINGQTAKVAADEDDLLLIEDSADSNSKKKMKITRLMPTGSLLIWATDTAPGGFLLCYGQSLLRATYADLFAVIGTAYGSADGTHFNVPDLRGRFPLGQDDMGGTGADRVTHAQADSLAGSEGSETHALTEAELPAHSHDIREGCSGSTGGTTYLTDDLTRSDSCNSGNILSDVIETTGSDTAHENMPPYLTLNYIIKY